jgi:hypothetical protein
VTTAEFLATIVARLDAAENPHMIAGSVASSHHGEPRSTQDIDLVVDPTRSQLRRFVESLEPSRFYVNDALAALARRSMFNVIEPSTGFEADLVIRKDRAFSVSEFERRESVDLLGVATAVATVEDTILAKLEWAREGESERQLRDVAAMISVHGAALDLTYLRRWAAELGVDATLEAELHALGLSDQA